jgi:hypothetical protein
MTDAEEIAEAERIVAMVWDVHWESQRKINAAFKPQKKMKPEDEVALVLLTTLLQTKQLHSFLGSSHAVAISVEGSRVTVTFSLPPSIWRNGTKRSWTDSAVTWSCQDELLN